MNELLKTLAYWGLEALLLYGVFASLVVSASLGFWMLYVNRDLKRENALLRELLKSYRTLRQDNETLLELTKHYRALTEASHNQLATQNELRSRGH